MRRILGLLVFASALRLAACESFGAGADGGESGDAGVGRSEAGVQADATSERDGAPPHHECPSGRGPSMVRIGSFCIDSTEVTVGQYAEFLAVAHEPDGALDHQPAGCAWNTTFRPAFWWKSTPFESDAGRSLAEIESMPVTVVDWCDAHGYCAWAGKRLCSRVGGGASLARSEVGTAASEWFVACSRNGARLYPYGDEFEGAACNGVGSDRRQPVASSQGCVGGYDGLFDMTGNVGEWIDDCNDAGACPVMGGNFGFPQGSLHCGASDTQPGDAGFPQAGFRCCATPPAP
jgi:formylglycine-generating enzyme required for sulfatase activity